MEASVLRRDTIVTRGEYQQRIPQNKAIMQSTVQKKVTDLQRKIRESTQVSSKNFEHLSINFIYIKIKISVGLKLLNLPNPYSAFQLILKNRIFILAPWPK